MSLVKKPKPMRPLVNGAVPELIASASSVVVSNAATATATATSTVFPWGNGDGTATFNVPDMRGRIPVPHDAGGGAGRVTTAGSGVDGATVGATGGAQNVTLDTTMIPSHSHTITDPGHTHPLTNGTLVSRITGAPAVASAGGSGATSSTLTVDSASTGITTTNSTGGGAAHNNMPPVMVLPIFLRVL